VLETLLPLATEVPLLFLCACRPDEKLIAELLTRAHAAYAPNYCRIGLSPLTREESSSLIQRLLKIEQLPEKIRGLILDRAEGNPFFLEELLRSLLDCGAVRLEQGRVIATGELESVEIPETLEGVLMSRIDRLEADDKHTLQNASVIGRVFQERVLTHLHEKKSSAKTRLRRSLDELQRREFVQSREQQALETAELQEDEYIFKHAATHQVAYDSLLLAKRKELHKLAAEAIETLFPDRLGELSATIGYHFAQAQVGEKAAYYLGLAAERAQATFANTEAIGLYRSAISQIEPSLDGKPDLQKTAARFCEGLGDVLKLSGQHLEARAAYDRARAHLPEAERISRSRLHRKSGSSFSIQRHYEQTGQSLDLAEKKLGDETGASTAEWWQERVEIELERMHLYYWQGMADEMMQVAEQNRVVVEQRATPIQRGKFFQMLALSQLTRSRYRPSEECLRLAELSVSESKDSLNLSESSHARFTLGLVHLWRGNFAEAIEHCEAALRLAERVGDLVVQARCLTYLATAHRRAHHLDETRHFAVRTQELAAEIGMVEYVAMAKANLAWLAWREGKHDDALTSGREALELWHGMEDPYGVDWMALWPLIAIALDQNNMAQAIEHARALFGPNQHPLPQELMVITQKAIAAWQKNVREIARTHLEQAVQIAHKVAQL
jgi:predicted ATPase